MKGWFAACLLLVVLAAVLIARRDSCDKPAASRDLTANHLLQTADWREEASQGLACPAPDSARLAGRYLKDAVGEGGALDYSNTLSRPALDIRSGLSLRWLNVKDAENLSFVEPGARFDACEGSTCPLPMLRVEALRCSGLAPPRYCEVAVIVTDAESARITQIAGKPIRLLFRQEAIKGGKYP